MSDNVDTSYRNALHVVPINDLKEHVLTINCWCNPEEQEEGVLVHNAADGREDYENGKRKPH